MAAQHPFLCAIQALQTAVLLHKAAQVQGQTPVPSHLSNVLSLLKTVPRPCKAVVLQQATHLLPEVSLQAKVLLLPATARQVRVRLQLDMVLQAKEVLLHQEVMVRPRMVADLPAGLVHRECQVPVVQVPLRKADQALPLPAALLLVQVPLLVRCRSLPPIRVKSEDFK